ncbi:MAG: hypothetical protein LBV46_04325 [Bacteroidales bacterium]|jgi:Tfp pilus assembly protein PilF|nr:hypothetical protein [Bacteroidales bacterium]
MKRNLIVTLLLLVFADAIFAQQCVTDAWNNLMQEKVIPAKKKIDECFLAEQNNADVWLMRGNVYYFLFKWESGRMQKNSTYVRLYPDAILIADESFKKALSLNKDVQA